MDENWKDIEGYEGLYQISDFGRVRRLDSIISTNIKYVKQRLLKGRILTPNKNKFGYLTVGLSKCGKVKRYLVHRLVAQAFIPNPNNYPVVNHKDEDKSNDHKNNLEWCSQEHNMNWKNVMKRKVAPKLRKTDEEKKLNRERYVLENREKIKEYKRRYFQEHYTHKGKTTRKVVKQFTKDGEFIATFPSIANASEVTNINYAHISSVCNKKRKSAGGFVWEFAA